MSDITLSSKEYCESVFVDGPKFDKLSAFVSGPDAQVQGKLTAGTGINLNGSTISVNTASSVGTSTLPVTASAVNTKLSSYVNSVSSPDGSITVTKSGSSLTLKANGGGSKWVTDDISGAGITYLFLGKDENHSTVNSIFVCGPLYADNPDNSIFVAGPIKFNEAYDKDGNEIKGGGGGAGYDYINEDHLNKTLRLSTDNGVNFTVAEGSLFANGPIVLSSGATYEDYSGYTYISNTDSNGAVGFMGGFAIHHYASGGQQFKIGVAADTTWTDAVLELESYDYSGNRTGFCQFNGNKLEKLSSLIYNADALLALLKK